MTSSRLRDTRIPRKPFLWLTAALLFTVPPMFGTLAMWVPLLFVTVLAAKFWMEPRDYRLRSAIWKLLLGAVVLAAVFVTYGSVEGIEPGVSIVVTLMSLKILEAHTAREFQVMVNIGWIFCLCGFFLSQDFAIALCVLIACILLLASLLEFHSGSGAASWWFPLRTAAKILLQAAPLIVALFIFFPRIDFGFRWQLAGSRMAGAGFSGELSPGGVSSLANSNDVAFRAEFPDGRIPRADTLYWRGVVLSRGYGFEWRAPTAPATLPRSSRRLPAGPPIRQSITIEPHGNKWMFALDWPFELLSGGGTVAPGNYLSSAAPIRSTRKYEVVSFGELADKDLRPRERERLLEVPASIAPAVRDLAQSWSNGGSNPVETVSHGLQYFRDQGFRYSLSPGEYQNNNIEEFLFRRRIGFCEHYAATFATLMRLAGVPARVVIGYLGGEYNEYGHFFVVRQSDAHAWCEVWLPERGWTRVDPTSVVAPDRVTLGFNAFIERRTAGASAAQSGGIVDRFTRSALLIQTRAAWQALTYAWDTRVLSYDEGAQYSLLSYLSAFAAKSFSALIITLILVCLAGGAAIAWIRMRNKAPRDRVRVVYEKFCNKLRHLGVAREAAEGPADFANRAARLLPGRSERINRIARIYIELRYAEPGDRGLFPQFRREVRAF